MPQEKFLRLLLPEGAITIMAGRKTGTDKIWFTEQYATEQEAIERLRELDAQGFDTYVATARYGSRRNNSGSISRHDSNIYGSGSMDLDIDVGPNKYYKTLQEAKEAIDTMLEATGLLPPTVWLMSGHGYRLLWRLSTTLTPKAWAIEIRQLRLCVMAGGLRLDDSSSTDIKRGIRVPLLFNYKDPLNPVKVKLVSKGPVYSIEQIRECTTPKEETGNAQFISQDDLVNERRSDVKLSFTIKNIGNRCRVLTQAIQTGGKDDDEPHWVRILQLLACAKDGKDWIHKVSDQHPTYNYLATEEKFNRRFDEDGEPKAGPTLCATFQSPACENCIHRGRINTPAKLGLVVQSLLPYGYTSDWRGTFKLPPEGDDTAKPQFISATQFVEGGVRLRAQADNNESGGNNELVMHFRAINAGNEVVDHTFPTELIGNEQGLKRTLCGIGVMPRKSQEMVQFMTSWVEHLQRARNNLDIVEHIGWIATDSPGLPDSFCTPRGIYAKGAQRPHEVPQIGSAVARAYGQKGSMRGWQRGAQAIIDSGSPPLTVAIALSFAAPLMRFTNVEGGIISLSSGKSGTGKTTSMCAGFGVWGDPHLGLFLADDTANSVLGRIGIAPHYPVYWDEIITQYTPDKARELITQVFRIVQGREKSRMTARREITPGKSWQTMVCLSSNFSLMDVIRNVKDQTSANLARIIEFSVPNIGELTPQADLVKTNFGHAGDMYGRWLSKNSIKLAPLIPKLQYDLIEKEFKGAPETRFWAAMLACLIYGSQFATRLGIVNIDAELVKQTVLDAVKRQKIHHKADAPSTPAEVLMDYLSEMRAHTAVFRYANSTDMSAGVTYVQTPDQGAAVFNIFYASTYRLDLQLRPFRRWLTQRSYNTTEVVEQLTALNGCSKTRDLFGKESPYPSGRHTVIRVRVNAPDFKQAGLPHLGGLM